MKKAFDSTGKRLTSKNNNDDLWIRQRNIEKCLTPL